MFLLLHFQDSASSGTMPTHPMALAAGFQMGSVHSMKSGLTDASEMGMMMESPTAGRKPPSGKHIQKYVSLDHFVKAFASVCCTGYLATVSVRIFKCFKALYISTCTRKTLWGWMYVILHELSAARYNWTRSVTWCWLYGEIQWRLVIVCLLAVSGQLHLTYSRNCWHTMYTVRSVLSSHMPSNVTI